MTSGKPLFSVQIPLVFTLLLSLLSATSAALAAVPATSFQPTGTGPAYPDQSHGERTAVPSIEAFYLGAKTLELDGILNEPAWDLAQTGWGFQQHEPDRGTQASVPNTFKILYDDDALYIGMACWENDISDVSSYLSRRDQIESSDLVSIYIDPYHDRTTGYNFRVNMAGVQQDSYIFDNGNRDDGWNAVWEAEVTHDHHGWYVEMRIPFSAIRFKSSENMTWGLQVYRWLHGRGEDTGWVTWDRNLSGFVSRWGNLTGLRAIENPSKLEIMPYFVTSHTDPATADPALDNWDNLQNFGADLKYGLTPNLTLNATFQPDFGQVESDPAVLNLSPFETRFNEKRPFFVEGARFFQHPDFNLFYSRRIGTGEANSRIRGAAKLTGKIGGDLSVAFLGAATDLAEAGKVHNPFSKGRHKAYYSLVRVGKEFAEGKHNINFMGTGVFRDDDSFADVDDYRLRRDGLSSGADFEMNFQDRTYRVKGSLVGTRIKAAAASLSPYGTTDAVTGHGGRLDLRKIGGNWRGGGGASWESDRLDPNDMGILQAPDEIVTYGELGYYYDSDGEDKLFNRANFELEAYTTTLYAGNSGHEVISRNDDTFEAGELAWEYDKRHHQFTGVQFVAWGQLHNYNQGWVGIVQTLDGTDKWATRSNHLGERGPLMDQPGWTNIACSGTTDWRKPISLQMELHTDYGSNLRGLGFQGFVRWNQSEHLSHSLGWNYRHNTMEAQWLDNFVTVDSQLGQTGIGGVDYVFAEMDQKIWDATLRSSMLFNRDQSLQLYLQPFLTRGNYTKPRYLATADSYDLKPYEVDTTQYDFKLGSVNLNMVYRWEYKPGSTLYLVWTHSNFRYEERGFFAQNHSWENKFDPRFVVDSEPQNTFMAKLSYWFSI
ncbi:MAG: carbohydrate binding family 9 domain-containing protein [Gemmatimonadales bacterium]|nr:carbohydrate binding family 9 domain-containing protein [Gemmatimonadales bacterium]